LRAAKVLRRILVSDLPINVRSFFVPPIRIALTTAVKTPKGAVEKRMQSAVPESWLKNCLLTCSPKRVRSGARLLITLAVKLSWKLLPDPGEVLVGKGTWCAVGVFDWIVVAIFASESLDN
jgi:hypothetical protein